MKRKAVALVEESRCIGCTRCIEVCPVDAIVGAHGLMHTVVEDWCIGCALCPPACPVDCIDMLAPRRRWTETLKRAAGRRARARRKRMQNPPAPPARSSEERKTILSGILSRKSK